MNPPNLALAFERRPTPFDVRSFRIERALGRPARARLVALCPDADLDLDLFLGESATFVLAVPSALAGAPGVMFRGVCERIALKQSDVRAVTTYELDLVSPLGLLGYGRGCRVYQRQSAVTIATAILEAAGLPYTLDLDGDDYPALECRTQYDESNLDFLQRVLEEAGIATFTRELGPHPELVLTDHPGNEDGLPIPYSDSPSDHRGTPWATALQRVARVRERSVSLSARDFLRPLFSLGGGRVAEGPAFGDRFIHQAKAGLSVALEATSTPHPVADARGKTQYEDGVLGTLAERHLAAQRSDAHRVHFASNVFALHPGMTCAVLGHPRHEVDGQRLLVLETVTTGAADGEWRHAVQATFATPTYRPPRVTPRPRIHSVETATVTGPGSEDIHVDEHGRVKVRLHWDRFGATDDASSCWLRVSQGWAGAGFGWFALPRVGHEVLVGFVGGDPDHPVVVGQLHNGMAPPPFPLPDDKTKTGLRTHSTPQGGFNELSFEDALGREKVFLRAERDLAIEVQHDRATHVEHDDTLHVAHAQVLHVAGTQTIDVFDNRIVRLHDDDLEQLDGSRRSTITGDLDEHVRGSHRSDVEGDASSRVRGDKLEEVRGELALDVTGSAAMLVGRAEAERAATLVVEGNVDVQALKTIELASDQDIVLRVGQSFIHITSSEITLSAGAVTVRGQDTQLHLAEGEVKVKASSKFQVVSDDAIVLKSSAASLSLKSQAKLDGTQVLLNSPDMASDSIETSEPETTVVSLVDQDNHAIPYQRFKITFSDGSAHMGFLDHEGKATVERSGSGEIVFPDLLVVEED